MLAGKLGRLDQSLKGAKIRLGCWERPNEMAKARGGQARCSVAFVTEDLGLEAYLVC